MTAIQIGIIIFLIFVLAIVYQDEYKKRRLSRKSAKLKSFWKNGKERRKSIRINTEIDVLYEIVSSEKPRRQSSMSRNIGLGGINLALNEKLNPGTTLELQLNLPLAEKPIFTQGKIIWVKEILERFTAEKEQRFFATGIKFVQLKGEDAKLLHNFINDRLKDVPKEI